MPASSCTLFFFFDCISVAIDLKNTLAAAGSRMGVYCMQCSLESGRPEFTYLLENGWSDLRIGRIIFEQEGLNGLLMQS